MDDPANIPLINRAGGLIDDCWKCWSGPLEPTPEPEEIGMQVRVQIVPEEQPQINEDDFIKLLVSIQSCKPEQVKEQFDAQSVAYRKLLLEKRTSSWSKEHSFPPGLTAFHCVALGTERPSESVEMVNPDPAQQAQAEALREIIEIFDANGDINAKDGKGYAPLHYAVITNSEFTTKLLLESEKCDRDLLDGHGRTPLMVACLKNADKAVKELIPVLQPNILLKEYARKDTILHFLLKCERTMISAFLDAIIDNDQFAWMKSLRKMLNVKNDLGITPLQICVEAGQLEELKRLLDLLKPAVPLASPEGSRDPGREEEIQNFQKYWEEVKKNTIEQNAHILHVAAAFGFLIKDEKGEMIKNKDGENLLHVAAKNNHREIIKQLVGLPCASILDATDNNGMTPLLHTASTNAWEAADFMIDFYLNGNELDLFFCENNKKENMLILASNNNHVDFIEILLKHRAILTALDDFNDTVLHVAARAGHVSVVEYLLSCSKEHLEEQQREHQRQEQQRQQEQNQQQQQNMPNNPIQHSEVQLDVEQDIYVILNARNSISNTPLHEAAAAGFAKICQILLQKRADPKAKNHRKRTPFDVAISEGQAECVKVLLRYSDIDGDVGDAIMAPLHHAARKGHSKIVTYLLAKDAQIGKKQKVQGASKYFRFI
ncbi:unnamed protein product, partial [Mesorhabditis belari]|uniref:Uncharacterized protein n=1 Tax=Mesorhabditis belari TaxID=2138241 RepID=A0AAF3FIX1_9BILA